MVAATIVRSVTERRSVAVRQELCHRHLGGVHSKGHHQDDGTTIKEAANSNKEKTISQNNVNVLFCVVERYEHSTVHSVVWNGQKLVIQSIGTSEWDVASSVK